MYPELSLMPQKQRAQGLPLHASHPPYFLSFKSPSEELTPEHLQPRGQGSEIEAHLSHLIVV